MLGIAAEDILRISAKTGEGVPELLDAVVDRIPAPTGDPDAPLQALIFDSQFDQYRGVVSSIRVDAAAASAPAPSCASCRRRRPPRGRSRSACAARSRRRCPSSARARSATSSPASRTSAEARSGETVTTATRRLGHRAARLPRSQADGVLRPVPDRRRRLRGPPRLAGEAQAQRRLDHLLAGVVGRLGFGFRCGFLGLLHMEIVKERLEREFGLALIATAPSVEYQVHRTDGTLELVDNPADLPDPQRIELHRGAVLQGRHHHADRLHRHADGAVPAAPRRARQARVPVSPSGSSCTTRCRWPRSSSTSSTSSRAAARATPASTTSRPATAGRTSSRSTCC